jgi:predicted Zn-dependent peptidase
MVVAVAGPIDHADVVDRVENCFSARAVGAVPSGRKAPAQAPRAVAGEERDVEQVHVVIGAVGVSRHDPDREALDVVAHVLGGGPSSRLFQTIREERGLSYSTFASSSCYSDAGIFSAYAATNAETAAEVVELMEAELDALVERGITADERDIAVGYLTGAYAMGFEGTGSRVERLGGQLTSYGEIRPIADQLARWRAVSLDDTARVIARVLAGQRVRCAVGPVDGRALFGS